MKSHLASLCGVILLAGCVNTSKSNRPLVAMMDAPEFTLQNVRGGELKSSDLKGKVIVLDFWATWCAPCKVEIPRYNKLRAKLKPQGVEFIGITFDSGSAKDVLPFLKELNVEYPAVMGTDSVDAALGGHLGFPTTFIIGKDWKVYRKIMGIPLQKMESMEKDINALLAKP